METEILNDMANPDKMDSNFAPNETTDYSIRINTLDIAKEGTRLGFTEHNSRDLLPYFSKHTGAEDNLNSTRSTNRGIELVSLEITPKAPAKAKPGSALSIANLIGRGQITSWKGGTVTEQAKEEICQFLKGNTWYERNMQTYEDRAKELYRAMEREREADPSRPYFSIRFQRPINRLDGTSTPNRVSIMSGGRWQTFPLR